MRRLRIKELAEAQGYDQQALARRADVSNDTVRRIWHNPETANPRRLNLEKIANALGCDVGELWEPNEE